MCVLLFITCFAHACLQCLTQDIGERVNSPPRDHMVIIVSPTYATVGAENWRYKMGSSWQGASMLYQEHMKVVENLSCVY